MPGAPPGGDDALSISPVAADRHDGTRLLAPDRAHATRVVSAGALYLRAGRACRRLAGSPILVGRAADCDFVIDRPAVAPYALRLHRTPGGVWIERLDACPAPAAVPRRLELPADLRLTADVVLRIAAEPPAARRAGVGILASITAAGTAAALVLSIGGTPRTEPAVSIAPVVAPPLHDHSTADSAASAEPANGRSDRASAARARSESPTMAARGPTVRPAPVATLAPAPLPAPSLPAGIASPDAAARLEQAAFWIERGLPQRARELLDTAQLPPELADRAHALRSQLRQKAEALRVEARAVAPTDPEAARDLLDQAAALLSADDPLHPILRSEMP